jgi:hypothetical protein
MLSMEHERNSDSYDAKVKNISIAKYGSDNVSEAEITDSDAGNSVRIQPTQYVEIKNSGLPHSINNQSTAQG